MSTINEKLHLAQQILGYQFMDTQLLRSAITHPSAVENKPVTAGYERLEFLGDSVVGFLVADEIFRKFPDIDEGGLTRLKVSIISGETLSKVAHERGFEDIIIMGLSEKGTGARGMHSALENVYEAVTGAIFIDGGLEPARRWVLETLGPLMVAGRALPKENPKSLLQEKTQAQFREAPRYELISVGGPAHVPVFTCDCLLGERHVGRGVGSSKKEAEAAAAQEALKNLGYVKVAGTDESPVVEDLDAQGDASPTDGE